MAGKIVIVILLLAVIAGGVFLFNTVSKNPVKTAGVVSSDTALGSLGWSQIPNTKLSSVCPPDAFGYSFSTKCDLVISAWGGGIADTKRNRMIIWGGGHGDYAGNEVYALDLADLKMKRLNNPSSPTSGSSPSTSDGKANSRHTYSGLAYVEHLDKMYVFSGSLYSSGVAQSDTWFLDMATLQWERVIASGPSGNYNVHAFYDPQTKKIFLGDRDSLWRFDPDLKTYTRIASYSHDLPTSSVLDPNRRIWLTIGGTYNSPNSPFVKAINVDTGATVSMNLNGCSAITTAQAPGNGDGSGPAMAYDPVADEIVAWMTGDTIWIIDLETKSCMSRTFAGGPGTPTTQGTYGRFRYFPDHDAFVIVNKPSQDAYILRLRQGDSQPSNCTAISGFASDCAGSIPVLSLTNPSVSGTNLTVTVSVAQSGTNAIYKTGYYWNQAQNQWIP
ncbi:MAG: hypothetical protein Q8R37_02095, partial [Nanoarchaeota archaeon]|nr:hypothetical protein [Nanoarchaeota archaeon]